MLCARQVQTTRFLDICGIEIQILSASGNGSNSWVVKSRGHNRSVEELHYNDPDYSPGSYELVNQMSGGKSGASEMQVSRSSEETLAQPRIHRIQ